MGGRSGPNLFGVYEQGGLCDSGIGITWVHISRLPAPHPDNDRWKFAFWSSETNVSPLCWAHRDCKVSPLLLPFLISNDMWFEPLKTLLKWHQNYMSKLHGCMFLGSPCCTWAMTNGNALCSLISFIFQHVTLTRPYKVMY